MRTGLPTFDATIGKSFDDVGIFPCLVPRTEWSEVDEWQVECQKLTGMDLPEIFVGIDGREVVQGPRDIGELDGLNVRPPFDLSFVDLGPDDEGIGYGVNFGKGDDDRYGATVIATAYDGSVMVLPWTSLFWLDEEGAIRSSQLRSDLPQSMYVGADDSRYRESIAWTKWATLQALYVFAHVNARGVELVEVQPTRQQRRDAERRGDPVYKHYTLRIGPTVRKPVGRQPASGDKRDLPLHLVRGHVARYTAEAPLFGKHTGQFWVRAHVRGKAERGVIDKTYRVAG